MQIALYNYKIVHIVQFVNMYLYNLHKHSQDHNFDRDHKNAYTLKTHVNAPNFDFSL